VALARLDHSPHRLDELKRLLRRSGGVEVVSTIPTTDVLATDVGS